VRTTFYVTLTGLIVGACLSAGCKQDEDPCESSALVLCKKAFECDAMAAASNYDDVDSCQRVRAQSCRMSLTAPDVNENDESTRLCRDAVAQLSCDDFLYAPVPRSCHVQPGAREAGMACIVSAQCTSGMCLLSQGAACGACARLAHEGEHCEGDAACEPDMACLHGVCVAPALEGAACAVSSDCARQLSCEAGRCTKRAVVGSPCSGHTSCVGGASCDEGLCEADHAAAEGETCGRLENGDLAVCLGGRMCGPHGKCLPRIAEGGACLNTRAGCAGDLRCIDGVCQLPDATACEGAGPEVCFCSSMHRECELDDAGNPTDQCTCDPACCCG
jgi:hypothetical protein